MIMFMFRITRKLFVKFISFLISNSRKNLRQINKNKISKVKEPHVVHAYGKINAPNLVMLLQAIGFQLQEFEISKEKNSVPTGSIQVTIQCGSSQMNAVLKIDGIECQCPSDAEAKEGSLWTSCGTDPSLDDNILYVESGTSLLPEISEGVNTVLREVALRLFKMINNPTRTASSPNIFNFSAFDIAQITGSQNTENQETVKRILRSSIEQPIQTSIEPPIQTSIEPPIQTSIESPIQISIQPPIQTSIQPPIQTACPAPIQSARALSFNEQILYSENPFSSSSNVKDEKTEKTDEVARGDTKIEGKVLPAEQTSYCYSEGDTESSTNLQLSRRSSLPEDFLLAARRNLDEAIRLIYEKKTGTSSTSSVCADFFNNPPPPSPPRAPRGSSLILKGHPPPLPAFTSSTLPRSSTFTSDKSFSVKPPTRRSVPAPISKTSVEKSTTSEGEKPPMRRRSGLANIVLLPSKPNPQHKLSVPKTTLNSSMNSLNLSDKRRISPSNVRRSTLMPKRSTCCPNTLFRGPGYMATMRPSTSTSGPSTSTSGPSTSTSGPSTSTSRPSTSTLGPSTSTLPTETTSQTSKGTPGKTKLFYTKVKKESKDK